MSIPPEIQRIIEQINTELDELDLMEARGLNSLRRIMSLFPENAILTRYFGILNSIQLFTRNARNEIQLLTELVSQPNAPFEVVQECGEDLGTLQGKTIELKEQITGILNFLENLP
ncbi:hypothetical protein [Planktothrix sp.]|uniref:hypothetical protein n=1 Tax=Planktothrix sp. TaxID=3088171 RepID=UPI0038D35D83